MMHRTSARLVLTVVALLGLLSAAPGTARAEDPLAPLAKQIAHQDDLAARGDFDTLLREAKEAARDGTSKSLYLLGRAYGNAAMARRAQGREKEFQELIDKARDAFDEAQAAELMLFPPAMLGIARCERQTGQYDAAIQRLEQAIKIAPDFRAATVELAQVYADAGRLKDAEFVLRRQLEKRPDDLEVRMVLGLLKMTNKRYEEAETEFRAAAKRAPDDPGVRKALGASLLYQEKWKEAAEHFEFYRRAAPKDDEPYRALFMIYRRLMDRQNAVRTLDELRRTFPGTDAALWAERVLSEVNRDEAWADAPEETPRSLARKLDDKDPAVVKQALRAMRSYDWDVLPSGVYKLLATSAADAESRALAAGLVATLKDVRTFPLLEILVLHPKERDPEVAVRRAAAAGIADLPTAGVLPVLYRLLDDPDEDTRETAVRGFATLTGKNFRTPSAGRPDAAGWAAERALWRAWWEGDATFLRRDAATELLTHLKTVERGRKRLSVYAVSLMDARNLRTWRAAYDLFRALSGQTFGHETGEPGEGQRATVLEACRNFVANPANLED